MGRLIAILVVVLGVVVLVAVVNRGDTGDEPLDELPLTLEERFERNPDDDKLRIQLAESIAADDPDRALELLTSIAPESSVAFDAARGAYLVASQSLPDQLESTVQKLWQVGQDNLGACLAVAEYHFNSGRPQQALEPALKATGLDPDRKDSWLLLADIYDSLSQPASAVEPLRTAIRLDAEDFAAHANLAHSLFAAGEKTAAKKEVEWCLQRQPKNHQVLRILADIQRSEGEISAAMDTIQAAIKVQPDDVRCLVLLADLFIYQREGQKAYALLSPLRDKHQANRPFLSTLARAAALSGRRQEAGQIQQMIAEQIRQEEQNETFQ